MFLIRINLNVEETRIKLNESQTSNSRTLQEKNWTTQILFVLNSCKNRFLNKTMMWY